MSTASKRSGLFCSIVLSIVLPVNQKSIVLVLRDESHCLQRKYPERVCIKAGPASPQCCDNEDKLTAGCRVLAISIQDRATDLQTHTHVSMVTQDDVTVWPRGHLTGKSGNNTKKITPETITH